jgi:hypothetical protein
MTVSSPNIRPAFPEGMRSELRAGNDVFPGGRRVGKLADLAVRLDIVGYAKTATKYVAV